MYVFCCLVLRLLAWIRCGAVPCACTVSRSISIYQYTARTLHFNISWVSNCFSIYRFAVGVIGKDKECISSKSSSSAAVCPQMSQCLWYQRTACSALIHYIWYIRSPAVVFAGRVLVALVDVCAGAGADEPPAGAAPAGVAHAQVRAVVRAWPRVRQTLIHVCTEDKCSVIQSLHVQSFSPIYIGQGQWRVQVQFQVASK